MTQKFTTGKTFATGEQVTAQDLENIVELATPLTALTDDQTLSVNNGQVIVKDGSSTDGVSLAKMKHIAARSIVGNNTNSTSSPNNLILGASQILRCNESGTALEGRSGSITIDASNSSSNRTVHLGDTLAVNGGEGIDVTVASDADTLTITGENASATNKGVAKFSTDNFSVSSGDVTIKNGGVNGDELADSFYNSGTGQLTLGGSSPFIQFEDSDNTGLKPTLSGGNDGGHLIAQAKEASSDIRLDAVDKCFLRTTPTPGSDHDSSSNDYTTRLEASSVSGKDTANVDSPGVRVHNDLRVDGNIKTSTMSNYTVESTAPTITFHDTSPSATDNNPFIKSYDSGSLELVTENAESDIILDAKDDVILQYNNNTVFRAGDGQGREADNTFVAGCRVDGALQVTGEANIGTTKLGASSILASTPSTSDNSTKIASTAFVNNKLDSFVETAPSGTTVATSGSVTLPGGLIMKFGKGVSTVDGDETFTYPTAFPNNHFCTNVSMSAAGQAQPLGAHTTSLTGFTIDRNNNLNGSIAFNFISIGN